MLLVCTVSLRYANIYSVNVCYLFGLVCLHEVIISITDVSCDSLQKSKLTASTTVEVTILEVICIFKEIMMS
jgi:hypothetical protein